MTLPYEPVTVVRTGVTTLALVDPDKDQVWMDDFLDLVAGDVLSVRGQNRRVTVMPDVWREGGTVVTLEPPVELLPDFGALCRPADHRGHFDPATSSWVDDTAVSYWTGPLSVEPDNSQGSDEDVAEQQVGVQPFIVKAPLTLTDVRSGDVLTITTSRDARLLTRSLVVTRVQAGSGEQLRVFRAIDRQE